jgi:hypothetical protein
MIKTPKAKEYGKRMQVISVMYLHKWTKFFYKNQWVEDDIERIHKDAADLSMVGQYMIEGDFDAAYGLASDMDTAVRDEIPRSVYNYLEKFTVDQQD